MFFGTDFEGHSYWQAYAEEPAAKELVARNTHTIASGKAQGIYWNRIKCKERCENGTLRNLLQRMS
jgi:hypothetical protein